MENKNYIIFFAYPEMPAFDPFENFNICFDRTMI